MSHSDVFIVGAGPAGLTAAYLLTKQGIPTTVIEADPTYVGGISRTASYKNFLFDIGGHRFFSKSKEVVDLWNEILPHDFIQRPRMSRIYYEGKFYSYPLRAFEALRNLGLFRSAACMMSYARWKLFPIRNARSFEDWTVNQFGRKLFSIFFKTYTEKVWGMACSDISADWAAQRIKGLSLGGAVLALGVVALGLLLLGPPVRALAALYGSGFALTGLSLRESGALLAGGSFLGWAGAGLAAARHLRAIEPK